MKVTRWENKHTNKLVRHEKSHFSFSYSRKKEKDVEEMLLFGTTLKL